MRGVTVPARKTREVFDGALTDLIGLKLHTVRYYEINYGDEHVFWDLGAVHNLDFGLDLGFGGDRIFNVAWSGAFFQYGLELGRGSLLTILGDHRSWDVSTHSKWSPLIGNEVLSARYWWSWVEVDQRRVSYPQDLEFTFGGGTRVFLTAGEYDDKKTRMSAAADNVAVVFAEEDAARFELGPFAPDVSRL